MDLRYLHRVPYPTSARDLRIWLVTALPYWRRLFAGMVACLILVLAIGLLSDARAFGENFLAGIAGMILGILVALFFVDRVVDANRAARWRAVEAGTRESIIAAVVNSALAIYLQLPAPRPPNADPFMMNEAGDLGSALDLLAKGLRTEASRQDGPRPSIETVGRLVVPPARVLGEVVLPRLMLLGAGPNLVGPIVELEHAVSRLEYHIWMDETFGSPRPMLFEDLAGVAEGLNLIARATEGLSTPPKMS